MAITNPEAIAFSDQRLRPLADAIAQVYFRAKQVKADWVANNMGDLIGVGGGVIRDSASPDDDNGTGGDGRHVVTGNDANVLIGIADEVISQMEATTNQDLNGVLTYAVNIDP